MKILNVAAEACPFFKSGGLADVVYALSKEIATKEETFVIIPFYKKPSIDQSKLEKIDSFVVNLSWRRQEANIYRSVLDGVTYFFVENDFYFAREALYGYEDEDERFAFFTLAVRDFLLRNAFVPDIIHIHDWHPGMLGVLLREKEEENDILKHSKIVLTIHNPAFQGLFSSDRLYDLYGLPYELYENGQVRFKGMVSTLKSAIIYADKITTVSPNHRYELLTKEGGMGLDSVLLLREYDFIGVLNGIDYEMFNPNTDPCIKHHYNGVNFIKQKKNNRQELLKLFNLKDYGQPLYAIVSRMTWQKGLDVLFPAAQILASKGCNVIMLGSGEARYENMMEELRAKYPDVVGVYRGYSEDLAHLIYASCDVFLMPSLFEPCGLGQMIAQRYGALPLVRYTGGLKDSVLGFDGRNADYANGFGFNDFTVSAMIDTSLWALESLSDPIVKKKLQRNALKVNNSWNKSAKEYLKIYTQLLK